ncbi:hypothetical protein SAMN05216312_101173 [Cohnella sp. OV330]|uniref:hypothetical protein n=1 Tax=Cohnella sp. OV330 TaxID=1855288 RepID=UPI0008E69E75|nr:hypothetical protein [Cohnella sp. OV330]SFA73110.1 hypothetical protein SAMN05216312_101173 [Cohnella sp. OV330]
MSSKKRALTMAGVFVAGVIGGAALMYSDSVYDAVNDALGKGATQNAIGSVGGMTSININGMDLETAMMAVQSNRASGLEQQLKDQIAAVQAKNDQIAKLNQALASANRLLGMFGGDAKADTPVPSNATSGTIAAELQTALKNASLSNPLPSTKGQLDGLIQTIKSQIDALANSQQMDMLRLQSLSNKRNEAFDTMSNFVQKMQESRSSIIGNMR